MYNTAHPFHEWVKRKMYTKKKWRNYTVWWRRKVFTDHWYGNNNNNTPNLKYRYYYLLCFYKIQEIKINILFFMLQVRSTKAKLFLILTYRLPTNFIVFNLLFLGINYIQLILQNVMLINWLFLQHIIYYIVWGTYILY